MVGRFNAASARATVSAAFRLQRSAAKVLPVAERLGHGLLGILRERRRHRLVRKRVIHGQRGAHRLR
jgi:hypothetical protein